MEAVKTLLRVFAYLYHGALALFLLGVSILALTSGGASLHLGMLPWHGGTLAWILLVSALLELVAVLRAIRRARPGLLFLWSLVVAFMLVKGYFFSSYRFAAGAGVRTALYLVIGSLLALVGAWVGVRRRRAAN